MPGSSVTKAVQGRSEAAWESFNKHHASIWGQSRWYDSLKPALEASQHYVLLINEYVDTEALSKSFSELTLQLEHLQQFDLPPLRLLESESTSSIRCTVSFAQQLPSHKPGLGFLAPVRDQSGGGRGLLTHWNLDASSVLAAHALNVQPGDKVADLCGAPGGKSIALAQSIWPQFHVIRNTSSDELKGGCLHLNEHNATRSQRLASNIKDYLPQQLFASRSVRLLRLDGTSKSLSVQMPLGPDSYNRVLVDVPCSGERHLVHAHAASPTSMMGWRLSNSKNLQRIQVALLTNALRLPRIGGRVVYATCSIEDGENDGVVRKCLSSLQKESRETNTKWTFRVDTGRQATQECSDQFDRLTEKTDFGRIVLPDHPGGGQWGPLYFSVLTKVHA